MCFCTSINDLRVLFAHLNICIVAFFVCFEELTQIRDELGRAAAPHQRGEPVLHCFWSCVALSGVCVQSVGVRRRSTACLG